MMPIGPMVRRALGRYERPITELYRHVFIDLDTFAAALLRTGTRAAQILEIGCGEGAMTERLARIFPDAMIMAIDISPKPGRMFRGDTERVSFRQVTAEQMAAREPSSFGLIVVCDVLHHVPIAARGSFIDAARRLLAPGGLFVFKDWSPSPTPIHWLCHAADRYLTGDDVRYPNVEEAVGLLTGKFGSIKRAADVPPWSNNFVLLARAPGFRRSPS